MPEARLHEVIRSALGRRRLRTSIGAASRGAVIGLAAALLTIVLHRLTMPGWSLGPLLIGLAIAGPAIGIVIGLVRSRRDTLLTAIELERHHHFKERLSSALFLERATPADCPEELALLVRADSESYAQRVDVRGAIPIGVPRSAPAAGSLLALVALTWWLLPAFDLFGREEAREQVAKEEKRIEEKERRLRERAQEMKKLAERHQLSPETKKLLAELSKKRALPKTATPREATRKPLADLESMKKRAKELAAKPRMEGLEDIVRSMQGVDDRMETEQGQRAKKAMSDGSPQRASEALAELSKQLAKAGAEMSKEQRDALSRDLEKLAAALSGSMPELSESMMDALSQLKSGDSSGAAKSLGQNADQLARLARLMREKNLLDQTQQEIEFTQDELAQLPKEWKSGPPPEICPDCLKGT